MMATMKAAVIREVGGPEVLKIETLPIPIPQSGEVLIRVKAFGLNRSELFTRQGHSHNVKFPRVLGIEVVGLVESAPGNEFRKGDIVATAMGGMGREFDGGYAEYTCVPAKKVQVLKTKLTRPSLKVMVPSSPRRPVTLTAKSCCVPAVSIRCSSTPDRLPNKSGRSVRKGSTRCSNSWAPRR